MSENLFTQNAENTQEDSSTATTNVPEVPSHDNFNWSISKKNVIAYSEEDRNKYDKMYDTSFNPIKDGDIVNGIVMGVTKTDAIINIGYKSDGLISLNEFRDITNSVQPGDEFEVLVVSTEDKKGNLVLSRKMARIQRAWEKIKAINVSGEIVTGLITGKTKGGLIVELFGMETFLPGSQIDVKPITDYDQYVGNRMEFKVVKINEAIRNAVVSHKALIESDMEVQRMEIMSRLEKGQVVEGMVKNITDFGVFMDLGGIDGLLYITEISWGRVNHPSEVLEMNQKINVVVLDFDDDKKRISLGLKQLTPHPWETLPQDIKEGSLVKGKIVNIEDYGAFLEIVPGVEGLIHVSEINWDNTPINLRDYFKAGDVYEAKIVTINRELKKMSLSLKQLISDPWIDIDTKYPENSRQKGIVKNITNYGVFVELEKGIGGMIHISDLSWLKRIVHPNDFTKVGNEIDVIISMIDKENRKLQLGHKQLEEDPWDVLENTFAVGTVHDGVVIKKEDKGVIVQLSYGLEGFAPNRQLMKEDGSSISLEGMAKFMVLEFDRNEKKIIVGHTKMWEKEKDIAHNIERKDRIAEHQKTKKAVKNIQDRIEKVTLGSIGGLASIKEKLQEEEGQNN
ncbi:MAG: 30S ribosomal protein S1 [Chitinophagaceae bacterium]